MKHTERASQIQNAARDFGVLHYLLAYLDWDCGLQPAEVIADLLSDLLEAPNPWSKLQPLLRGPADLGPLREDNRASASWESLHSEFARWAQSRYGLADTAAWQSVVTLQTAVMPACGRAYPETIKVPHDVVAWYTARCRHGLEACALDSQPAGQIVVRDPWSLSNAWSADRARACSSRWELDSALMEARAHFQANHDALSRSA